MICPIILRESSPLGPQRRISVDLKEMLTKKKTEVCRAISSYNGEVHRFHCLKFMYIISLTDLGRVSALLWCVDGADNIHRDVVVLCQRLVSALEVNSLADLSSGSY